MSEQKKTDAKHYWAATICLTLSLLAVWVVVSYGIGILFRNYLDQFVNGGAPLCFRIA